MTHSTNELVNRFKSALGADEEDSVIRFFQDMSETDRVSLRPTVAELRENAVKPKTLCRELIGPQPIQPTREEMKLDENPSRKDTMAAFRQLAEFTEKKKNWEAKLYSYQTKLEHAALATFSLEEIQKLRRQLYGHDVDILLARKPDWLSEFFRDRYDNGKLFGQTACELCLLGVIDFPRDEKTTLLFLENHYLFDREKLADVVQRYPRLQDEVWNFLDLPVSKLQEADRYAGKDSSWETAIIALGRKGVFDRNRILNATHRMLKSIKKPDSELLAWPCKVHKGVAMKPQEVLPYVHSYLVWLDHPNEMLARMAFDLLLLACKDTSEHDEELLERFDAPLRDKGKDRAAKVLALLESMLGRSPSLRKRIIEKILMALEHDTADLQSKALTLLASQPEFNDADIVAHVEKIRPLLSASVRTQLSRLSSNTTPDTPTKTTASQASPPQRSVVWQPEPLMPIGSLEEFIDVAVTVLENKENNDQVERLLDYMSRIKPERTADFLRKTSALVKRAVQVYGKKTYSVFDDNPELAKKYPKAIVTNSQYPFRDDPLTDIATTIAVWRNGEMYEKIDLPKEEKYTRLFRIGEYYIALRYGTPGLLSSSLLSLFSRRTRSVARNVAAGKQMSLLSTPTHVFGWIDPRVFVKRLEQYVKNPDDYEIFERTLALSRLLPDHRDQALESMPISEDEYILAARYALGDNKIEIGPTVAYWVTAARVREPLNNDAKVEAVHPGWGPDSATAATYQIKVIEAIKDIAPKTLDVFVFPDCETRSEHSAMPCVLTHFGAGMTFSCPQLCLDWASSVWPTQWEPLFASPIQQLTDSMDKPGSLLESQRFYRLLARPDIPFRDNATLLLAVGLCHKNPEVHLPSTDILIAAATDRRILPRKLGEILRFIFDQEMMKPLRPAMILADVAHQSQEHLDFVRAVLEALLLGELKTSLAPFLELLLELCLESNQKIESDELRQSLTLFKGTGKSAKAVKQLLALK